MYDFDIYSKAPLINYIVSMCPDYFIFHTLFVTIEFNHMDIIGFGYKDLYYFKSRLLG